jgi:hypothetical protein
MKNKRLYIILGLILFIIFILLNIKIETKFNKYAKTAIYKQRIDFGTAKLGDTILQVYHIDNVSKDFLWLQRYVLTAICSLRELF